MSMKQIQQQIPVGKTLKIAGLVFVGPCTAKVRLPDSAEPYLIDTPQPVVPDEKQLQQDAARGELAITESSMPGAVEDLIDTLTAKGVLKLSDLPAGTQQIFTQRKAAREKLAELQTVEMQL